MSLSLVIETFEDFSTIETSELVTICDKSDHSNLVSRSNTSLNISQAWHSSAPASESSETNVGFSRPKPRLEFQKSQGREAKKIEKKGESQSQPPSK